VDESARDHQHQSIARRLLHVDVGLDQRVLLDSVNGRLDPLELSLVYEVIPAQSPLQDQRHRIWLWLHKVIYNGRHTALVLLEIVGI